MTLPFPSNTSIRRLRKPPRGARCQLQRNSRSRFVPIPYPSSVTPDTHEVAGREGKGLRTSPPPTNLPAIRTCGHFPPSRPHAATATYPDFTPGAKRALLSPTDHAATPRAGPCELPHFHIDLPQETGSWRRGRDGGGLGGTPSVVPRGAAAGRSGTEPAAPRSARRGGGLGEGSSINCTELERRPREGP